MPIEHEGIYRSQREDNYEIRTKKKPEKSEQKPVETLESAEVAPAQIDTTIKLVTADIPDISDITMDPPATPSLRLKPIITPDDVKNKSKGELANELLKALTKIK